MARKRGHSPACSPYVSIVLPAVHSIEILRLESPQTAKYSFDVHGIDDYKPIILLWISIATPHALAFSDIFDCRNLVSLYTRLSEYLFVDDFNGSMM
jgi:hypothetical protein